MPDGAWEMAVAAATGLTIGVVWGVAERALGWLRGPWVTDDPYDGE